MSNRNKSIAKTVNFVNNNINTMVTILKSGTTKKRIKEVLKKLRESTGIDAFKYCGIIKLKEDALAIQKQLRNEWQ